jgi:uncharacterized protein (DUF433 family)
MAFRLKRGSIADLELEHLAMRTHLVQQPQTLHDPVVQVDEFRLSELVDVDLHGSLPSPAKVSTFLTWFTAAAERWYQPRPKAVGCMPELYARLLRVYTGVTSMTQLSAIVQSDPAILGGTPVFVGTRVPIQSLFDYLEGGETLDEFLRQFPSVRRDQAIAVLDLARATLLAGARSS